MQQQIIDRVDRSVNAKIKKAGFPYIATLEMFDFSFQPTIDEKLLRELSTLSFLNDAKNILMVGGSLFIKKVGQNSSKTTHFNYDILLISNDITIMSIKESFC